MFIRKYLHYFLFGVNLIITICLFGYLYLFDNHVVDDSQFFEMPIIEDEPETIKSISVEVKGAVKNPGVYNLESSQIINDVISLAGGFKNDAYTNNINLSKHLSDEMLIYVYTKNEYLNIKSEEKNNNIGVCQKEVINMCIENGESIIISGEDITVVNKNDLININTATKTELTSLNGIGEAKAQSIIDYRNQNGLFKSIDEILKVSGISQTIYDKIKNNITV